MIVKRSCGKSEGKGFSFLREFQGGLATVINELKFESDRPRVDRVDEFQQGLANFRIFQE